ncbi:MAG: hypothetical protein K8S00_00235 [Bacteroidales bacterium]|nr:hypothetical protein [Bacteroidales bacterium]
MKHAVLFLSIFCILTNSFAQDLFHDLNVEIDVKEGSISVIDVIHFKEDKENKDLYFYLNRNLNVKCLDENYSLVNVEIKNDDIGSDPDNIAVNKYKIESLTKNSFPKVLPLSYDGIIKDEIKSGAAEYARGFSETKGIISENGVYLAGSSFWVPYFPGKGLMTFNMNVKIDSTWGIVSQGERTVNDIVKDKKFIKYESPEPMDDIYLIAAQWTEYHVNAGNVLVQAFLRTPDEKLAARYLNVTSSYIKLYEELIGKYPYKKFALVENFWETGYGMPSFTLLGEKVIRFPWILHSSYPHELLHNYWGNSVYVDYEKGNWCEGITVYMADHLIKEQSGQGAEYRRNTLQKYTDFVNPDNDFPLTEFRSRNNSAEEAIGYGKSMMLNEMLRFDLGDEIFLKAYAKFYSDNKFKKASFDDIRKSFEEVSDKDLKAFFDQWLNKTGAPKLEVSNVKMDKVNDKYELKFVLSQVQDEDAFDINVPVAIYLKESNEVIINKVNLHEKTKDYSFIFDNEPLKIEVDPQYNVFRRLDKREVPNTLSQIMGDKSGVIVLPKQSSMFSSYMEVAKAWKQIQEAQDKSLEIVIDAEIESLPTNRAIWIFGFENKFADKVQIPTVYYSYLKDSDQHLFSDVKENGSLVYALPNPENGGNTIGFLGTNMDMALSGLARKLPHYGKYSYLGFEGDEPTNVLKGIFPVINSPLNIIITDRDNDIQAKLIARKALSDNSK